MNLSLKRKLDYHYHFFCRERLSPDPLELPHKFNDERDIELTAFIASVFAYGNIKQILNTLTGLEKSITRHPYEFIQNFGRKDHKYFKDLKHRFYTDKDIISLFGILNKVILNYGSIKQLFLLYYFEDEKNLKNSISSFVVNLINLCSHCSDETLITAGLKFMFPDPLKGSACKRMNLFLRWMIRKDELDFGLWSEISTSQLVIPVDTHVARICKELKLTTRKTASWLMAEEITENLKKYDPVDPVKYDFAICHIGMRNMEF